MTLNEIQSAIASLPQEDFDRLLQWIKAEYWESWDHEILADDEAGVLDFLCEEALSEKARGELGDL